MLFVYIVAVLPDVGQIAWLGWPAGGDGDFNIQASVCTIQQTPPGYFIEEFNLSSTSHPKQYSQGLSESGPVCLIIQPNKPLWPGPVFCLLLGVSSDYTQPITGQVTEVTCPMIGWAQPELTPSKRQKRGPGGGNYTDCWPSRGHCNNGTRYIQFGADLNPEIKQTSMSHTRYKTCTYCLNMYIKWKQHIQGLH